MLETSVNASIDWFEYTVHWHSAALQQYRNGYALDALATAVTGHLAGWIKEKPCNGYPYVVSAADCSGLRFMATEPNARMGIHVSWSGSALKTVNPMAILKMCGRQDGTPTRIDLAVDCPDTFDQYDLYATLSAGQAKTASRTHQLIQSNKGWTIYVGSRTSEKFLRIYDKQAEAGLEEPLTRVELECKGDYAEAISAYVLQHGYSHFPEIIRAYCDFPDNPAWVEHLTYPIVFEGVPKPEKQSDTRRWLMESVAPSLAKIVKEDHDFYVSFLLKVMTIAGVGEAAGEPDIFEGQADWTPRKR